MENESREKLLDAALELLGGTGGGSLTLRAVERAAGLPHGSVRHHFGDRAGLIGELFDHLAAREGGPFPSAPAAMEHWLGPGRNLTLARYELFLLAAREASLRDPLVRARDRFVAAISGLVGADEAATIVAALDGVVLDALVRGDDDPERLRGAIAQITSGRL